MNQDQENIRRLLVYDEWANNETLRVLKSLRNPPQRSVEYLAHIIAAEFLWLERWHPQMKKVVVWPALSLEECEERLTELQKLWSSFVINLDAAEMGREVSYVNSKGESWKSRVRDILFHVVVHSAQHRGQIAANLRAAGFEPPYTDYIQAVRSGSIG